MAKPKITRIKAGEASKKQEEEEQTPITRKKVVVKDKKLEKANRKEDKKAAKAAKKEAKKEAKANGEKKPFILFRPFVALFRYIRESGISCAPRRLRCSRDPCRGRSRTRRRPHGR